jgi:hypothetical protein
MSESDRITDRIADRLDELTTGLIEERRLRERLADILTRTADALHGGPLPDGWWSWHDLPKLVERLRRGDDPARDTPAVLKRVNNMRDVS